MLSRPCTSRFALAGWFGQPTASGLLVEHGLSQRQLAEMVGTSRESLNRQLHGFAERGWLVAGRGLVVIRDPDRLGRRAAPEIDPCCGAHAVARFRPAVPGPAFAADPVRLVRGPGRAGEVSWSPFGAFGR